MMTRRGRRCCVAGCVCGFPIHNALITNWPWSCFFGGVGPVRPGLLWGHRPLRVLKRSLSIERLELHKPPNTICCEVTRKRFPRNGQILKL